MQKEISLTNLISAENDIEIGQWLIKEGDAFKPEDTILEVLSEKATFEVTFNVAGKLIKILHSDGEIVSLNDPIAVIETTE